MGKQKIVIIVFLLLLGVGVVSVFSLLSTQDNPENSGTDIAKKNSISVSGLMLTESGASQGMSEIYGTVSNGSKEHKSVILQVVLINNESGQKITKSVTVENIEPGSKMTLYVPNISGFSDVTDITLDATVVDVLPS